MYMGEAALQGSEPSNSNVVAQTNVDLLQLQRSDAVRLLGTAFLQLAAQSTVSTVKKVISSRMKKAEWQWPVSPDWKLAIDMLPLKAAACSTMLE